MVQPEACQTANRCVGVDNSATRGAGCLPQADWKRCLNRVWGCYTDSAPRYQQHQVIPPVFLLPSES